MQHGECRNADETLSLLGNYQQLTARKRYRRGPSERPSERSVYMSNVMHFLLHVV